ncbi:hypothetical protein GCM10017567_80240 [Amycolatopsis bullii]|uniref:Uncharacterized protein n=1 Tax=Amycolatopsis bullii TaxID=941987 RepID=A0ABQ3KQG1_9PSEU|nr:hypothetical protein GCM10017567_80240 [Amycolatopsis bullii]
MASMMGAAPGSRKAGDHTGTRPDAGNRPDGLTRTHVLYGHKGKLTSLSTYR